MALRYCPKNHILIDVIPFFTEGEYHIFYLKGNTDDSGWSRGQTPWGHIKSKDLIVWDELGDAIDIGNRSERDGFACFTGSVIIKDGIWHIYYTGFNPGHPDGREAIMHATSIDREHFVKDVSNPVLEVDKRFYGAGEDWRDPFVFWNEEEKCYFMTITAGAAQPISGIKRGVIGLAKSYDLQNWTVCEPIYAPANYPSMECSDVFKIGDWWYLLFSQDKITEYRMARSIYGPWICPKNPVLDGGKGFFYAAKTLFDGNRRLLFGWCGTLEGNMDGSFGEWGGDMVSPRELTQNMDGELQVRYPEEMGLGYKKLDCKFTSVLGEWQLKSENSVENQSQSGLSAGLFDESFNQGMIKIIMKPEWKAGKAGVLLNSDDKLSNYYYIFVDFGLNVVQIMRCKSKESVFGTIPVYTNGLGLISSQFIPENAGDTEMVIFYEGDILEVFVDQRVVTTARIVDIKGFRAGLFAEDAKVDFKTVTILTRE